MSGNIMHVADQIRSFVVELAEGLSFGSSVFDGPVHPVTPDTIPGACVYLGPERNVGGDFDSTLRQLEVRVDLYALTDADLGSMLAELEAALYGDEDDATGRFFDGAVTNLVYGGNDRRREDKLAVRHWVLNSKWLCEYQTEDGNAEVAG